MFCFLVALDRERPHVSSPDSRLFRDPRLAWLAAAVAELGGVGITFATSCKALETNHCTLEKSFPRRCISPGKAPTPAFVGIESQYDLTKYSQAP